MNIYAICRIKSGQIYGHFVGFMKCLSVHVYRQRILQGRYRDFTEILLTFVISINGLSFAVLSYLWRSASAETLKRIHHFFLLLFLQWYPRNSYYASIQVSLLRRNSKFSAEVIDALMLAVKENAHECKLDLFVKVRYMLHNRENIYLQTCCCCKK